MSELTLEQMDRINFLLTEVSLECLGNKYYDIYGDETDSLLYLLSTNSLKPKTTHNESHVHLTDVLGIEELEPTTVRRKRRVSFSDKDVTVEKPVEEQESLLVPMEPPRAAKISRRRSTITVSNETKQQRINRLSEINNKSADLKLIKEKLRQEIHIKFQHMQALSMKQEAKYRTLSSDSNLDDFYKAEEKGLFAQCNTLIQFIKYIQEDSDNSNKLRNISEAILELKQEY